MSSDDSAARCLLQVGAAAALTGLAVMGIELTAVRLLAPHFGDSAYVWTNVIGAILLALAAGAWIGGRLAERPGGSPLGALLGGAAILIALVPLLSGPLGGWLLPQELPLDAAMPALEWGSLAATLVLFAPPVWLLGAVSPGLITRAVRAGVATGRAAGTVSALGTAGSLVGTFAATHWLVPSFGARMTMWLCALSLLLAALVLHRSRALAAISLFVAVTVFGHHGPLRQAPAGTELLAERQSRYQYLQVVRSAASADTPGRTELKINEGLDSFHSLAIDGSVFTSGAARPPSAYYDYHALVPLLAGDGARPSGLRALSIGDAAGSFRRIYAGVHPGAEVDAVEIDPVVVALGDEFFPGPKAAGDVVTDVDGRVFVELATRQWHAIHVDAYSHQVYVPAQLASVEFFTAVRRRLLPGGVVACNVGGMRSDDPVVVAVAETMAAVFGAAHGLSIPQSRNFLLVARCDGSIDPAVVGAWERGRERLGLGDREIWDAVLAVAADPSRWTRWTSSATDEVLVDDVPRLDRLLRGSYVDEAAGDAGAALRIAGDVSWQSAEGDAYRAYSAGRHADALAAIGRSTTATPYLRYLAGSARWSLRQLRSAAAEYRAGLALAPVGGQRDLRETLQDNLDGVLQELGPRERAAAVGARNAWTAFGLAIALPMLLGLLVGRLARGR